MSAASSPPPKTVIDWKSYLKKAWGYALTIGGVAIVSTAIAILVGILSILHDPVYIDDVVVRGFKDIDSGLGRELATRIKDRIESIYRLAAIDTHRGQNIAIGAPSQPVFKLDKALISINDVVNLARLIPGFDKREISISLDLNPDQAAKGTLYSGLTTPYRVIIRSSFADTDSSSETVGSLDQMIERAALGVVKLLDLPLAANYLKSSGPISLVEASNLGQRGVESSKGDAKARAHMVLGFILGAEGRIDGADASFQEAGKLSNTTRGRAAALDGQAYIRIKANSTNEELEKAGQLLNDADKQDSSYDSAQFHRAEIKRYQAENRLKSEGCAAEPDLKDASDEYKRLTDISEKKGFAVAYDSEGTMWLQLVSYMQFSDDRGKNCPGIDDNKIDSVVARADVLFKKALQYEPGWATTWLQWAILSDEMRAIHFKIDVGTKKVAKNGVEAVDTTISRASRAVQLDEANGYAIRRLVDAIEIHPAENVILSPDPVLKTGISSFCKAFPSSTWYDKDDRDFVEDRFKRWCSTGNTKDEPSLKSKVEHVIEKITSKSPDTKEGADAKSGERDSGAKAAGNTNYPDFAAVKKTDK